MTAEEESGSMTTMRRRAVEFDDDHLVERTEDGVVGAAGNPPPPPPPPPPPQPTSSAALSSCPRVAPLREVLTPERAIELVGMGSFQRWLTALCMLGNAADAVEVLSVALVLPTAGREFGLSDADKGLLTSCIFAGGFVGALGWGLVGDRFGRRTALAVAMFINTLFALLSAAATDFTTLVLCRTLAGIGVSGSNTVVFTTLPEFLPTAHRGTYMVLLASGWMWGSIYSASVGWAIVPLSADAGGGWRSFLVASAIPSLLCLVGVVGFMPESPRFLAVRGRRREALAVLRRIAAWNGTGRALPPHAVLEVPGGDKDEDGDGDGDGDGGTSPGTRAAQGSAAGTPRIPGTELRGRGRGRGLGRGRGRGSPPSVVGGGRWQQHLSRWAREGMRLYQPPLLTRTAGLAFVWFSLSFGWYGLMLWLPEYFTRLTPSSSSSSSAGDVAGEAGVGVPDRRVYTENVLVAWANLPGNVASAFMVDRIGRRKTLASCMAAAALAAGLFAAAPSMAAAAAAAGGRGGGDDAASDASLWRVYVACACVFNALSVGGWNALDLYCAEAFPTAVRSTAMGTLSACGRLGSLIGSAINGYLIGRSLMAPLGLASVMMLAGSAVTVGIPLETKGRALEDGMGELWGDEKEENQEERFTCVVGEGESVAEGVTDGGGDGLERGRLLSGAGVLSDDDGDGGA